MNYLNKLLIEGIFLIQHKRNLFTSLFTYLWTASITGQTYLIRKFKSTFIMYLIRFVNAHNNLCDMDIAYCILLLMELAFCHWKAPSICIADAASQPSPEKTTQPTMPMPGNFLHHQGTAGVSWQQRLGSGQAERETGHFEEEQVMCWGEKK